MMGTEVLTHNGDERHSLLYASTENFLYLNIDNVNCVLHKKYTKEMEGDFGFYF